MLTAVYKTLVLKFSEKIYSDILLTKIAITKKTRARTPKFEESKTS